MEVSPSELDDYRRSLEMIDATLEKAQVYFERYSESMAALHMSDKVYYSPICTSIKDSRDKIELLKFKLEPSFGDLGGS